MTFVPKPLSIEDGLDYGVIFQICAGDDEFDVEIEVAPDSASAPDTGNSENLGIIHIPPEGTRFWSYIYNDPSAILWFRFRHVRDGWVDGAWTGWHGADARQLPPIENLTLSDCTIGDGRFVWSTVEIIEETNQAVISWAAPLDAIEVEVWEDTTEDGEPDAIATDGDGLEQADFYVVDDVIPGFSKKFWLYAKYPDGNNGPYFEVNVHRPSGSTVPTVQEEIDETGSQGVLTLTVNDPDELTTQVRYRTKVGKAAFSDWTIEPGPSPYGPWFVDLDTKHISYIEYEISYVLNGVTEIIQSAIAYDTDNIAEIMSLDIYSTIVGGEGEVGSGFTVTSRNAVMDYVGDADTKSIKWAVSTVSFPSRADVQAGTINNGRTDTNVHLGSDFSIELTVYLSVLAYTEVDAGGAESSIVYHAKLLAGEESTNQVILNCMFNEGSPGEGSFWATDTSSTGVANSETPTIATEGVDFEFSGDGQEVTLVQVTSDDDDITKSITI